MDIFDRLAVISKSATILFNDIKLKSDPKLGIAVMEVFENYDKVKMRSTYKRLSELRKIDLIQKIKKVRIKDPNIQDLDTLTIPTEKHSYMINPHLLKPKKYTYASSLWEALKKADGKQVFNPEQPIILPRNLYQGD